MNPVSFPEQTVVIAENQSEYMSLPAHRTPDDPEGRVICCWRLSFRERLRVLVTGQIWHYVLTFGEPLQPQILQTEDPFEPVKRR